MCGLEWSIVCVLSVVKPPYLPPPTLTVVIGFVAGLLSTKNVHVILFEVLNHR